MSTATATQPDLAEQRRRQARQAMAELARLAGDDLSPQDFFAEMLRRIVAIIGSVAGAVWLREGDELEVAYQIDIEKAELPGKGKGYQRHLQLLHQAIADHGGEKEGEGGGVIVPQSSGGKRGAGNPTPHLLVLGTLKNHNGPVGVVEVFQPAGGTTAHHEGWLSFIKHACELAGGYLRNRQLRNLQRKQALWGQLETFSRTVHASLRPRQTAYTIANEGRRLIGCDRVSVALVDGKKLRIEAVSGQDLFDKRSNTISLLNRLATLAARAGEPLWYRGGTDDMPPQIERAVHAYVDESQTKMVAVLPLFRHKQDDGETRRPARVRPLGVLIVEQIEDTSPRDGFEQRVEVVRDHAGSALGNAAEHHGIFLLPLWRFLGKIGLVVRARALPKTLLVLGVIAAVAAALTMLPADFTLEGRGTLQPVEQRDVFAFVKGQVEGIYANHLSEVRSGQSLLRLRNTELTAQLTALKGEKSAAVEKISTIRHKLETDRSLDDAKRRELNGEISQIRQTLDSLTKRIQLYQSMRSQLEVASPVDGTVITLDVHRRLVDRPVERGQLLLTVANLKGEWELHVHMPEDRMGHILKAGNELKASTESEANTPDDGLVVEFILATDPGRTFFGHVKEIHRRAEVQGEEGNTVLLKVAINKDELPQLRPGASVIAKVHCGRRSVGYAWFHDVIEFVQARILFRF